MWENMVEPGRPQMTIWRMRITCWIIKTTDTHSIYVILTVFPGHQWLRERAWNLRLPTLLPLLLLVCHKKGFGSWVRLYSMVGVGNKAKSPCERLWRWWAFWEIKRKEVEKINVWGYPDHSVYSSGRSASRSTDLKTVLKFTPKKEVARKTLACP
jgi:hypothetical protein